MKSKSEVAVEWFQQGYNCAQSVVRAFREESALDPNLALKLACGFGAGMGRKQEVCGALSGGVIVLGLRHGRGENQDRLAAEQTYRKTQELFRRFELKHGSCRCRELLGGCDLTTEAGQKQFHDQDLRKRICTPCIQAVVQWLEEID